MRRRRQSHCNRPHNNVVLRPVQACTRTRITSVSIPCHIKMEPRISANLRGGRIQVQSRLTLHLARIGFLLLLRECARGKVSCWSREFALSSLFLCSLCVLLYFAPSIALRAALQAPILCESYVCLDEFHPSQPRTRPQSSCLFGGPQGCSILSFNSAAVLALLTPSASAMYE